MASEPVMVLTLGEALFALFIIMIFCRVLRFCDASLLLLRSFLERLPVMEDIPDLLLLLSNSRRGFVASGSKVLRSLFSASKAGRVCLAEIITGTESVVTLANADGDTSVLRASASACLAGEAGF